MEISTDCIVYFKTPSYGGINSFDDVCHLLEHKSLTMLSKILHSCSSDEWSLKRRHNENPKRWPSFGCEIEHSITLTPSLKSQRSRTNQQLNPKSPQTADHNSYTHPLADWEAYVQGVQIESSQVVTSCRTTPNWQFGHREHSIVCFQTMLVNLYTGR